MPAAKSPVKKAAKKTAAKTPAARMTLKEIMAALEKAGSAQTRKTYLRHGAREPMFGVSFATLKTLQKRIGIDHELALELWETGNFDASNLAFKIVDPSRVTPADLDRLAHDMTSRMCAAYVSILAVESNNGRAKAEQWLRAPNEELRCHGWGIVAWMAARDAAMPDAWFSVRIAEIEKTIRNAPNHQRGAMNSALIQLGGRSAALRKAALATAKKIGKVEVDHGDTSCKTPDAAAYIEKMWGWAESKGFESPSAQERERESPRTRC